MKNLVSEDNMKDIFTNIKNRLDINETLSLKEEISTTQLDLAVEMFVYLTACPDTEMIHLFQHLFYQTSISVKDITLTLSNALRIKPKGYLKKVWMKFTQVLRLQSVDIDQLINGPDLSEEDQMIVSQDNQTKKQDNYKILSKLKKINILS